MMWKITLGVLGCLALGVGSAAIGSAGANQSEDASASKVRTKGKCGKGKRKKACRPDLKVMKVSGVPKSAAIGAKTTVTVKVRNVGSAPARGSRVSLFISPNRKKSGKARKLSGKKNIRNLKPRKTANVKIKTVLSGKSGGWFVVACASKARKESRTGNNCGASSKVKLAAKSNPFPEQYVGTFTIDYEHSLENQNEVKDQTGFWHQKTTLDGDLTFTRIGGSYVSSGEFDWTTVRTSNFSDPETTEACSGEAEGTAPIVGYTGENFDQTWAQIQYPSGRDLSSGSTYSTWGDSDDFGQVTVTCQTQDGPYDLINSVAVSSLLPRASDECPLSSGTYNVKPDGRLAATETCSGSNSWTVGDNFNTTRTKVTWTWNLVPED